MKRSNANLIGHFYTCSRGRGGSGGALIRVTSRAPLIKAPLRLVY